MRIPAFAIAVIFAPGLASAMSEPPVSPPPEPAPHMTEDTMPGACDPDDFAHLIGQPRAAVEALTFDGPMRIIPPGARVTMDFRPDRINFDLDENGVVTRVRCG